jgi:type IV secretory pathway TraG/TraD family ATPase VirD4
VVCTSVLSLDEDGDRRLWLVIDELASLEKLASLEAAATKGRKHGLRLIAGLQSTSQLNDIYGPAEAQTLRSCFRSLVVLSGAKSDPQTCEDMSKALGEHEVERISYSTNVTRRGTNRSRQARHDRERVVMPSELAALPDLVAYVSFAGNYPISKVKLAYTDYVEHTEQFVERLTHA